jgi:hypothetical protein
MTDVTVDWIARYERLKDFVKASDTRLSAWRLNEGDAGFTDTAVKDDSKNSFKSLLHRSLDERPIARNTAVLRGQTSGRGMHGLPDKSLRSMPSTSALCLPADQKAAAAYMLVMCKKAGDTEETAVFVYQLIAALKAKGKTGLFGFSLIGTSLRFEQVPEVVVSQQPIAVWYEDSRLTAEEWPAVAFYLNLPDYSKFAEAFFGRSHEVEQAPRRAADYWNQLPEQVKARLSQHFHVDDLKSLITAAVTDSGLGKRWNAVRRNPGWWGDANAEEVLRSVASARELVPGDDFLPAVHLRDNVLRFEGSADASMNVVDDGLFLRLLSQTYTSVGRLLGELEPTDSEMGKETAASRAGGLPDT